MAGRQRDRSRSGATGSARPLEERPDGASITGGDDAVARSGIGTGPGSQAGRRAGGRWRLRNWRLRTKLAVVLSIPIVLALVFAGLSVSANVTKAGRLGQLATQVKLDAAVNGLVQQLQRERDMSVRFVATGHTADMTPLSEQRRKVDSVISEFQGSLRDLRGGLSPASAARFDSAAGSLDALQEVRQAVQNSKYPPAATQRAYTNIVQALLNVADQETASINLPELSRLHLAINAVARIKEEESLRRAMFLQIFQVGKFGPEQLRLVLSSQAERTAALSDFKKFATPVEQRYYDDTVNGPLVDKADNMVETSIGRALLGQPMQRLSPDLWDNAATVTIDLTDQVQQALQGIMAERTNDLVAQARKSAIVSGSVVLAALLLALLLALFVGRSLLRPLRTLRRSALEVAEYRLPEEVDRILADSDPVTAAEHAVDPVPVHTREEVGQVARAFDAVHGEAVRLASEQALLRDSVNAMFVNLSRRSQALVERQISLIDRLEADEQDPDQLSSLFELDHLATRMRRNSENLLVLSGTELGRRAHRPVPVADVLGAAISEVEQYARIELSSPPDLAVVGRAVNDLVHLLAELLDNATAFSDPQTSVSVRSARTRAGALAVEIADSGVGMSDDDLSAVNERLADPPEVDVGVSRRMGLHVVARLATRHDIKVTLREHEQAGGGVVARVLVPEALITREDQAGGPALGPMAAAPAGGIAGAFGTTSVGGTSARAQLAAAQPALEPVSDSGPLPRAPELDATPQPQRELETAAAAGAAEPAGDEQAVEPVPVRRAPVSARANEDDGGGQEARQAVGDSDAPTERLPIYEAVLSQWFTAESERLDAEPEPAPARRHEEALPVRVPGRAAAERRGEAGSVQDGDSDERAGAPDSHAGRNGRTQQAPEPVRGWTTPADEGWQAVEALEQPVAEVTEAGLPKRKPRAHLVPGSVAPRQQPAATTAATAVRPAVTAAGSNRSPDAVRGRMSSLQRGVRRGRHALADAYSGDQQHSNGDNREQQ